MILSALSAASLVELAFTFIAAHFGDRFGRIRVVKFGVIGMAILAVPQFLVFDWGNETAIFAVFILMRVAISSIYGPAATMLAQMFPPTARYTSVSLSYQTAGAIFGGLSPLVSAMLLQATGSIWPVILLLLAMCALNFICVAVAPQRNDAEDLAREVEPAHQ